MVESQTEKKSLDSLIVKIGGSFLAGGFTEIACDLADNNINSDFNSAVKLGLEVSYLGGLLYLTLCKDEMKEKIKDFKNFTIIYGSIATGFLTGHFL